MKAGRLLAAIAYIGFAVSAIRKAVRKLLGYRQYQWSVKSYAMSVNVQLYIRVKHALTGNGFWYKSEVKYRGMVFGTSSLFAVDVTLREKLAEAGLSPVVGEWKLDPQWFIGDEDLFSRVYEGGNFPPSANDPRLAKAIANISRVASDLPKKIVATDLRWKIVV